MRVGIDVPGSLQSAEKLWFDLRRWPSFVDGLAHVSKTEGGWPEEGSRVVWNSRPGGRGHVIERVVAREPGAGQTNEVEDEQLRGVQRVSFETLQDGVGVALELDYQLKERTLLTPLVDAVFIRRAQRDSLRRTLVRFSRELADDESQLR